MSASSHAAALAEALTGQLRRVHRVQLDLSWLRAAYAACAPTQAARPGAGAKLRAAVDLLADRGVIEVPVAERLWDHSALPPLPRWIRVVDAREHDKQRTDLRDIPWAPQIARWVGDWAAVTRPTASMVQALVAVSDWLLAHLTRPDPPAVAREERSLHIFGDEKRLARLERTSLFAPGRLSPSLLCYQPPTGILRAARLGDGDVLLIVENQATFDSAWRSFRGDPAGLCAVVFGNGWEVAGGEALASLSDQLQLRRPPGAVLYAGDLDTDGLAIPASLAAQSKNHGLPPPRPLVVAYEAMLHSRNAAQPAITPAPATEVAEQLAGWLPADLRERAATVLLAGLRIPQETLDRTWWQRLAAGEAAFAAVH